MGGMQSARPEPHAPKEGSGMRGGTQDGSDTSGDRVGHGEVGKDVPHKSSSLQVSRKTAKTD